MERDNSPEQQPGPVQPASQSSAQTASTQASTDQANQFFTSAPSISLPKGGGAIRGIGEKFTSNPVTGTGSMSVPIATSPGRAGFGPQLALSYDSGAGNGPFGLGWTLSIPAITRKTDKGLPTYHDTEESDTFLHSGAEDLVPMLKEEDGQWVSESLLPRTVGGVVYQIIRYRPRIEGLFARIERWTNQSDPQDMFWRSISKENGTSWYGKTSESRITDPSNPSHIFSWLLCETYDDKGQVMAYAYKEEDSDGINLSHVHEKNRTPETRSAQRYLKHIRYGNHSPYLPRLTERDPWPTLPDDTAWLFQVVFDYGEHDQSNPLPHEEVQPWTVREDPFSRYRAGFELRTYRLCQRVLMFHHFPDEPEVGTNCLVRSTDLGYAQKTNGRTVRESIYTILSAVTQTGYMKRQNGDYQTRLLPPVEFTYSPTNFDDTIRDIDSENLENIPQGIDGTNYRWVDLDGEGLSGILTEQGGSWFYKRNLSPLNTVVDADGEKLRTKPQFAPLEVVAKQPSLAAVGTGGQQLMDLGGNGQLDLVQWHRPTPGFYERTPEENWEDFIPFRTLPNIAWDDPNLRFIDLTGNGHADVLLTEQQAFTWYPSRAKEGFQPANKVTTVLDEEQGPRLVFAEGTQSIHLADMCGDGLTDLVRIRNGEICYWPNLGYGKFGAKVTMDHSPRFDHSELFDQRRLRLADIDGSGTIDILYLHKTGLQIYRNQSGNSWSQKNTLTNFPEIDDLATVQVADLLGNGTACITWASPLPGHRHQPMRYIDLMGGQKPHLLIKTNNNLGAESTIHYAPSTKFYLADKMAGKPWLTKLPFPVHVVERVVVTDLWRQTRFVTAYSYHHGYFDGHEREFRGFGRVDQIDVESYGTFAEGNTDSPYITDDRTLYQPPVKTSTWFHTGMVQNRRHILSQYKDEYFPNWLHNAGQASFTEHDLPEPDFHDHDLTTEEWREALRACKGMMLRQEVYELEVDALENGDERAVKLFSTAYHNCHIRRLQPQERNRHAVFLVTESEAITYNYELDVQQETRTSDPRIAHTFNLKVDDYGNVLQAVAVVYPRIGQHADSTLPEGAEAQIARVQREGHHLAYTEMRFTNDSNDPESLDTYRLRVPCEAFSYELTGPELTQGRPAESYFTRDELRGLRLSQRYQTDGEGTPVTPIPYHINPNRTDNQKRLVEHVRMLFFKDDLSEPLPLGQLGTLGLPYETYKLALINELLEAILQEKFTNEIQEALDDETKSGYVSGADLAGRFPDTDTAGQYWVRSGIAGFAEDAAEHFYLPERFTDAFGNTTTLEYDETYHLFVRSSTDPVGNTVSVGRFDYRVLASREIQDINHNRSEVMFDILGLPTAIAVKGIQENGRWEGDHLDDFTDALLHPAHADVVAFCTNISQDNEQARQWLATATTRFVYHFGETVEATGHIRWGTRMAGTCTITRERHSGQLLADETSPLQVALECSDGGGNVLMQKTQAEPDPGPGPNSGQPRWIVNGLTVLNNKGKPVKQYEPAFTNRFGCERPQANGVTPIMYYDAPGRLIRTELPDGTLSRVEFTPWHVTSFDPNDTVLESEWYSRRDPLDHTRPLPRDPITLEITASPEQRAAWLAAQHANTPAQVFLDSLGREVISAAHNRVKDNTGKLQDEKYVSFSKLDTEGKPLWIRDARRNLVMQYITPQKHTKWEDEPNENVPAESVPCYDIAGNLLFQHSMDGGNRWMINDATGQSFYAWDENDRVVDGGNSVHEDRLFHTTYDPLRRPLEQQLQINDSTWQVIERLTYGETHAEAEARNLRGQLWQHHEPSGVMTNEFFDFKGNLLEVTRQLTSNYQASVVDWSEGSITNAVTEEVFTQITEYDALNRMTRLFNWHSTSERVAVYEPQYNERGMLLEEALTIGASRDATKPTGYREGTRTEKTVSAITYDAKGQRQNLSYANGTTTTYAYDPETFRLIHLGTRRLADGAILQDLQYTYDPVGNITDIRDDAQQTVYFNNTAIRPHSRYEYDALYRLITAEGREHAAQNNVQRDGSTFQPTVGIPFPNSPEALQNYTERYVYDEVGNILAMRHVSGQTDRWTRRYQYAEDSNRLLGTSLPGDAVDEFSTQYDYDVHGSMLNLNRTPNDFRLRWDYRDMIHVANLGGGGTAFYTYDANKQRTRKRIERQGNSVEERLYLGGLEVYRRWENQAVVEEIETHHLFVDEQRVLIVEDVLTTDHSRLDEGTVFRYQYSNHLGSVGLELDERAIPISYEEYHPYGTTAYSANGPQFRVMKKRYRYTGMERDEETGLSYHTARFYLPWMGRWGSADPKGLAAGLNFYTYTGSCPTKATDRCGRQEIDIGEDPELQRVRQEVHESGIRNLEPNQPLSTPRRSVTMRRARREASSAGTRQRRLEGIEGRNIQPAHTEAARHVPESGAPREQVNAPETFQQLESARNPNQYVQTLDPQEDRWRRYTPHNAQERIINEEVDRSRVNAEGRPTRAANGGSLTPEGQRAAGEAVRWRTQGTGFDQREVEARRRSGTFNETAALDRSEAVQALRRSGEDVGNGGSSAATSTPYPEQSSNVTSQAVDTSSPPSGARGLLRKAGKILPAVGLGIAIATFPVGASAEDQVIHVAEAAIGEAGPVGMVYDALSLLWGPSTAHSE